MVGQAIVLTLQEFLEPAVGLDGAEHSFVEGGLALCVGFAETNDEKKEEEEKEGGFSQ